MLIPYVVLALRIALHRGHVFMTGDFGLIDLEVHRADRWLQLLGPYDRFGWHHPGPAYLYLISFVGRMVGTGHGLQAEAVTAVVVDGLAVFGCVLLTRRLAGDRAAAVVTGGGAAMAIGIGPTVFFNPWNPYVVVMPLALLGVLAVAAASGSGTSLAAAPLVGTFAVQTDVGCALLVAFLLVVAAGGYARSVYGRGGSPVRWLNPTPAVWVLVGSTLLAWAPVVYQQVTGNPRNLSAIVAFFRSPRPHAGVVDGVRAAGLAFASVVGLRPRMLPSTGPAGLLEAGLAVGACAVGVVLARRRNGPGRALLLVGSGGLLVACVAGTEVTGPTYAYLLAWAAAPALMAGWGIALVLAAPGPGGPSPELRSRARSARSAWPALAATVALAGLLARMSLVPDVAHYSDPSVATAWRAIAPMASTDARTGIALSFVSPAGWSVGAGLADELDARGVPFTVLPQWEFQFGSHPHVHPGGSVDLLDHGMARPPGARLVARLPDGLVVAVANGADSGR